MQIIIRIKYRIFYLLILFSCSLLLSLIISPYHVSGDQVHYSAAYDNIKGLSLFEGFNVYQSHIFTQEPIHFLISWISSNLGIEKIYTMSIFNGLLIFLFAKILLLKGYPYWLVTILSFNSYLMVLFFTLERNKFALICLFILILYKKIIFIPLSFMAHASVVILLIPASIVRIFKKYENIKISILKNILFYLVVFFIFALLAYLYDHFLDKLISYTDSDSVEDSQPFLLLIIFITTLIFSHNKTDVLIFFIPLFFLFFFIGSTRLNMYGFFVFLYFSNPKNTYFKIIACFGGLYLLIKSYIYILNIINYGG